jgi:hypothetical protein
VGNIILDLGSTLSYGKRKLYHLVDPWLEFNYSVKGAQRATQIAHHCLSQDPKARPLMDDVVEALTPLLNLKDGASPSLHNQDVQSMCLRHHTTLTCLIAEGLMGCR